MKTEDHDTSQRIQRHSKRWRTTTAVRVDNPTWSHDSRSVYYDTEGAIIALRRIDVVDDRVDDLATINSLMSVSGWSGLSPDDAPLLLKNLTSPAVYALSIDSRR